MPEYVAGPGGQVAEEIEQELQPPSMYRVLLHNDDYTTMDFVIQILEWVFRKPQEEAYRIMMNVHKAGVGMCGVYPLDIAETKVATVHATAQQHGFPLKCSMEPE